MVITRDWQSWTVKYRCIYRDHWYDDSEWPDFASAVYRAQEIQYVEPRRAVIVVDPNHQIAWARESLA